MIHEIEKDQAATIRYQPNQGVPTNATVEVRSPNNAAIVAQASATIDPFAATVAAATHLASTLELTVSAGSIVPGKIYWLTETGTGGYPVEITGFSGTTATLREPLRETFDGGAMAGLEMTYDLDTDDTATIYRNCQVIWRYKVATVQQPAGRYLLNIVRWPFALPVTEQDLRNADPAFEQTGADYNDLRVVIEEKLYHWVGAQKIYPDLVYSRGGLTLAAAYGVLAERHVREDDVYDRYMGLMDVEKANFLTSKVWYDSDDDAAQAGATSTSTTGCVTTDGTITSSVSTRPGEDYMPAKTMGVT